MKKRFKIKWRGIDSGSLFSIYLLPTIRVGFWPDRTGFVALTWLRADACIMWVKA